MKKQELARRLRSIAETIEVAADELDRCGAIPELSDADGCLQDCMDAIEEGLISE